MSQDEEEKPNIETEEKPKLETVKPDARYQNQHISNWCFTTFVDYQKCCRLLGEESSCCEEFAKIYKTICPNAWISRWEEQIENGTFPVDLPPKEDCEK